jgi:hypothetical protein
MNELPTRLCIEVFTYYLTRRRETVVRAILELRPELVAYMNLQMVYFIPDLDEKVAKFKVNRDDGAIPIRGLWNESWEYEFHGIGCKLRNPTTLESFDWDMGRPDHFYLGELKIYLNWCGVVQIKNDGIKWYMDWTLNQGGNFDKLLDFMKSNNLIVEIDNWIWTITPNALSSLR